MLKLIQTEDQYNQALARVYELMQPDLNEDSAESDELEVLSIVVKEYENEHYPIASPNRLAANIIHESLITCPVCGYKKAELMPVDSCCFFYECESCKILLKPQPPDCCVFCSYGSVKCPSVQVGVPCCPK